MKTLKFNETVTFQLLLDGTTVPHSQSGYSPGMGVSERKNSSILNGRDSCPLAGFSLLSFCIGTLNTALL